MQAILQDIYGPPEGLRLQEIAQPAIGDHEVLVRVRAASLHVGDCFAVRGAPFPVRFMTGLRKPKYGVPGFDLAGEIVAVGSAASRFKVGEEVFGAGEGACAEYARANEAQLALKPASLGMADAAALPTSGLAALHGLRDTAALKPGDKLLINGASGGVGTFAVQLGKALGAEVTAVCSARNHDLMRQLGADHLIDYTRDDFTLSATRYDVILDNIENRSLDECLRVLAPTGMLIVNSGTGATGLAMLVRLVKPLLRNAFTKKRLRRYISMPKHEDLVALGGLVEAGKLRPIIDRTVTLAEVPEALRYIEGGHARGKVLVSIAGAARGSSVAPSA